MTGIILKKNGHLKAHKAEIHKQIAKRVNETNVDSTLKAALESEVIGLFANKTATSTKRSLNNTFTDTRPVIPDAANDIFDNLDNIPLKEIPDDKPKDLYNRIVQMKVSIENEENAKKRIDQSQNQKVYKEELDKIIEGKKVNKSQQKKEENIWFNEEMRQVKDSEMRENQLKNIQKKKVEEEKLLRQKMLEEKIYQDEMAKRMEEENDKKSIEEAKRLLEIEKMKLEEAKKDEKMKLLQIYAENEKKRQEQKKQAEKMRAEENHMMQKQIEIEAQKQKKREDDFQARLKQIQEKMDKMADTVVRNDQEKKVAEEQRLLQMQAEKEMREIEEERERKSKILEHNRMINVQLVDQMEQKAKKKQDLKDEDRKMQETLLNNNRIKQSEDDIKRANYKNSLHKNKDYVLKQAEDKKNAEFREMNVNEEKLNRDLLGSLKVRNMI